MIVQIYEASGVQPDFRQIQTLTKTPEKFWRQVGRSVAIMTCSSNFKQDSCSKLIGHVMIATLSLFSIWITGNLNYIIFNFSGNSLELAAAATWGRLSIDASHDLSTRILRSIWFISSISNQVILFVPVLNLPCAWPADNFERLWCVFSPRLLFRVATLSNDINMKRVRLIIFH